MGYELDATRVEVLRSTSEGKDQLEKGMTLAVASLLVKGKGLSLGIIRNGTGFAQLGGGDINLARAAQEI